MRSAPALDPAAALTRATRRVPVPLTLASALAVTLAAPRAANAQSDRPTTAPAEDALTRPTRPDRSFWTFRWWGGPEHPRFAGPWLFDRRLRDALRAETPDGRRTADRASDVVRDVLLVAPYATTLAETLAQGGSWEDGLSLAAVNAGAFVVSASVTHAFKIFFGRERPYATTVALGARCDDARHASTPECMSDRNASFLSGHTASAFVNAGLVCAQRAYYSSLAPAWDAVICGAAAASASAVAILRIVADRHYATDTLAGAAVGLGAGLVLPVALHFSDTAPLPVATGMRTPRGDRDVPLVMAGLGAGLAAGAIVVLAASLALHPTSARARGPRLGGVQLTPVATADGAFGLGVRGWTF